MKKLLIIKLASLGDVLASTPLFSHFASLNYEVHHLVMENCAIITQHNPHIKEHAIIHTFPSKSLFQNIRTIWRLFRIMRRDRYDAALILHIHPLFQILSKIAGIRTTIGFNNRMSRFLTISISYNHNTINRTVQEFILAQKFEPALKMGEGLEYYPSPTATITHQLPSQFLACNISGASNIHSSMPNRRWPTQSYIELFKQLSMPIVLLGNGEEDTYLASLVMKELPHCINLVNQTTFDETALILQKSCLYLGNDSSLLYLSAAMDKPTVGLFGPTPSEAANPIGKHQFSIVSSMECSPCYIPLHGIKGRAYTCDNNLCMKQISVSSVLNMIQTLQKSSPC
ncbi:glycosyltransferase family 9 protein [Sulfuricurvum sp.]|nr:glycosyltransferase family 9 protein [Sulfuricurvum sp.]MDD4948063.1 glycosyltransferase family 9 protein [Sulfuricurvum sp.]